MRRRTPTIVPLLVWLWSTPASAAPLQGLPGTWSGSLFGDEVQLVLEAGGRGELLGEPVAWRADGSRLILTDEGQDLVYAFLLQGDRLTLSGADLVTPLVLSRKGGAAPASGAEPSAPDPAPVRSIPAPAAKGPGTKHTQDVWGATLTIPPGWKLAEREGVLLLGSDTEAGLIVVRFARKTGLDQLRQQYAQGLQEDGAKLFATGAASDFRAGKNAGLAGDLTGAADDGTPLQARAIGVVSAFGDAVVVLGVTSPQMFAGLRPRVEQVASSLAFTKPKELPTASFLAGHYWVYSGTSGYSTERKLILCKDGRFSRSSESGGSGQFKNQYGDVTGTYGAVGSSGGEGRWSASGNQRSGTLVLQHPDGRTEELPYVVSEDRADQSGWGPAVSFGGTKYQRTGDGGCR